MSEPSGIEAAIEQSHQALAAIVKGDVEPFMQLYSQRDDATLANPYGPPRRGIAEIRAAGRGAADNYRDGEVIEFERVALNVTPELAYMLEIERFRVKLRGQDEMVPVALRVTSIFRPEEGTWKLVHRHADPITTPRDATSVAQQ